MVVGMSAQDPIVSIPLKILAEAGRRCMKYFINSNYVVYFVYSI